MLAIIMLIITLFSPSFYVSTKKKVSIEKVIPVTIFSIILIIYVFGLLNLLKIGVYCVFLLVLLSVIANMVVFIKDKKYFNSLLKTLIKPSIFIWLLGIFLLYFYYRGRMIVAWDEFSHWGDVVKMMYYNNIYNTNIASLSAVRTYPPIMSIFQYFVENLSFRGFQEHYLFCAYQTFTISLLLPFIKGIKWREFFKILLVIIIVLLAPTIFFNSAYYYYHIIYIDPFLGILFGYIMASVFINQKFDLFDIIHISLALFSLTLTKDIAPVFSFISLMFIFFVLVICNRNYKLLKKFNKKNIMNFFKNTKPLWIFLVVVIISYLSWKVNVILNVRDISIGNPSSIKDVIKALLNQGGTYRVDVVNNYINALSNYKLTVLGNIYIFNSIIIVFCILFYKREKKNCNIKSLLGFCTIFIGELLYIFLMLVLYLLMFSEHEALSLASFDRYMGIYLTAILYFIIFITIFRSIEQKGYNLLLILLLIIIINSNVSVFISNIYNNKNNIEKTHIRRESYINAANRIKSKVDKNKKYKFYIIVQNSAGMEKWMLRYEIRDILKEMNEGFTWSLGEKYSENDIWTLNISQYRFKDIIFKENYDYIYLYIVDDKFIEKYGNLFVADDIHSDQLYRVNRDKSTIELVN